MINAFIKYAKFVALFVLERLCFVVWGNFKFYFNQFLLQHKSTFCLGHNVEIVNIKIYLWKHGRSICYA